MLSSSLSSENLAILSAPDPRLRSVVLYVKFQY